jgi:ABC-2 type transport system permease protein
MFRRIRLIIWKEFLQIRRDLRLLAVVIIMPVILLLLYGYAINFDVKHLAIAIYDMDRSPASRALAECFQHNDYFAFRGYLWSPQAVTDALDRGQARVVLTIPPTFSANLAAGRETTVQILVDGADSTTASTGLSYLSGVMEHYATKIRVEALRRQGGEGRMRPPLEQRLRYWYNPELRSANFLIPGLFAVILMMLAALLTSVTVVRERERGTLEQLIVSPIRPLELMLGKLIPYVLIAFGDVLVIMAVSRWVFHVPLRGNPFLVLGLAAVYVIAALGIGLFISTVARSQQVAMTAAMILSQLPSVILSGFIFPLCSMPRPIQGLAQFVPATHFIKILRAIYLKGSGLEQIWLSAGLLLVFGLTMITLSTLRFRKTLEDG